MRLRKDIDLLALQGSIKRDPQSYEDDFKLQLRHYKACLDVFFLNPKDDSQELTSLINFISQVASCYPDLTKDVSKNISKLLEQHYAVLSSSLRQVLAKALILMRNRNQVSAMDLLPLFFRLFRCQDKSFRKLLFQHIIADIKTSNQKHQNEQFNRPIQNFLYGAIEDPHEAAAKKSLAVLIELWRRQIWRDARTVNVIASAALQKSSSLMLAALKFFLGEDQAADAESDEDDDDDNAGNVVHPDKADVYRATKKGTVASKKKKAAKLKRVLAAVKKQQRKKSKSFQNFAAIQLLHDPQRFAEELFQRLSRSSGERFEVRSAMMAVISRVVGVHKLLLLNFYPFMQKYLLPHQRDAPQLLAMLVQAVHEEVPPDALAPVLRQLVDRFVHDRARPEVMTLGLKTARQLCERAPLIMTPELLQDLALYNKFREKEVASAARGLIGLFREVAPAMLEKRDRGRGADLGAVPLAFGARVPQVRVEGAELLQQALQNPESDSEGAAGSDSQVSAPEMLEMSDAETDEEVQQLELQASTLPEAGSNEDDFNGTDSEQLEVEDEEAEEEADAEKLRDAFEASSASDASMGSEDTSGPEEKEFGSEELNRCGAPKRKQDSVVGSLASLKKELMEAKAKKIKLEVEAAVTIPEEQREEEVPLEYERILTAEDFSRIRELRHKKLVQQLMQKHGLKSTAKRDRLLAAAQEEADEALERKDLRASVAERKVDPGGLRGRHKSRSNKEERLASVLKGREGREGFGPSASKKHKKAGGLSNREKNKKKSLPLGARKHVVQRRASHQKVGEKNFRGRTPRIY